MSVSLNYRYTPAWRSFTRTILAAMLVLFFASCTDQSVDPAEELIQQLLFLSTRDGATDDLGRPMKEIYRMNEHGAAVENLTHHPAWLYGHLSLSPDGNRIVFSSSRTGADIWMMNTDGSNLTRLTNQNIDADDRSNAWPRWSPDGNRIAFATNRENRSIGIYSGLYDVYVMNADGSDPQNVSHTLGDNLLDNVKVIGWSPDGRVVFETAGFVDGAWEIHVYIVNADGSGVGPLFDTPGNHSPAWSPDGSKVAFISERDGRRRLYLMNADGSGGQPLTDHSGNDWLPGTRGVTLTEFEYNPWSPDGTLIAFDRDGVADEWGTYIITADGSELTRLTDHPTIFNGWSPDGKKIAYTSRRLPLDVYVVNVDGSGNKNLTDSPFDDSDAVWLFPR